MGETGSSWLIEGTAHPKERGKKLAYLMFGLPHMILKRQVLNTSPHEIE